MYKVLFSCVFVVFAIANDLDSKAESKNVDIQTAWQMVLDSSDALKAQDYSFERAKKLSLGAKLSFLPQIDANIFYAHLDQPIKYDLASSSDISAMAGGLASVNPAMAQVLGGFLQSLTPIKILNQDVMIGALNIIYPLYTGGTRYRMVKIATIAQKDAKEALRLKKLATFEELVSVYYGAVLARDLKEVLTQIEDGTALHYQNALDLEKSGQIAHLEVLASQVANDKAHNRLKEASNTYEIASLALDTALSAQNISPTSYLALSDKMLQPESYYVDKTLSSYPALQSIELKVASAKEAKKLAIAPFLPQIVGFGSYMFTDGQKSLLASAVPTWYVGVAARISLITPSARIQKYQAAKLSELELESLQAQAKKDITLLVRKTYKEATYAREEYKSLESSIALARENLKLQQNAFKQGLATSAQVIDAQNSLQSALIEQKTIAYKAIVALAKLLVLSDEIDTFYDFQDKNPK